MRKPKYPVFFLVLLLLGLATWGWLAFFNPNGSDDQFLELNKEVYRLGKKARNGNASAVDRLIEIMKNGGQIPKPEEREVIQREAAIEMGRIKENPKAQSELRASKAKR